MYCDNFNDEICRAISLKIHNWRFLKKMLMDSSLPLTHYYYYGDITNPKVKNLPEYQWIVDHIEYERKLLQNVV